RSTFSGSRWPARMSSRASERARSADPNLGHCVQPTRTSATAFSRPEPRPRRSADPNLGHGIPNDALTALLGFGADDRGIAVDLANGPLDRDLLAEAPHSAELNAELPQRLGAAGGLGVGAGDLGHRPEAMEDAPRQADLLGELLVYVDRVEVARGPGVADGDVLVGGDLELDRVALLETHDPPLTMLVQVPMQTVSPCWFLDTDSKT